MRGSDSEAGAARSSSSRPPSSPTLARSAISYKVSATPPTRRVMAVQAVIMPKLGAYVDDIRLTQWLVSEGQKVAPGDAVFELETDKATAEVEAESVGWIHQLVEVDQAVPIGTTVALIAETHEEYAALAATDASGDPAPEPAAGAGANPFLDYIDHMAATSATPASGARTR